ncbi:VanZ family protein [Actinoplanes hulinensis]|uniref:VanZ family protein n=1 Tax=Actinoplanes hulinensis TaxID=1144547 RepID=A0ABS7B1S0_9ACTN|nr:VanZ family protein [Actinoplanes hulinensis]MBW6434228.1 VanZ family protein [Actinoplanes hulinensis]
MPVHRLDIPALPVLLPLGVILMIVSTVFLHRRGQLTPGRLIVFWFAGWYAVAILGATMLPMSLSWGPGTGGPDLERILWVPIEDMRRRDFVLNMVMTLPLGAVLHMVFGVRGWGAVVKIGFAISLGIESAQLFLLLTLHGLRWADVHDLTSNTFGTVVGYLIFRRLMRFVHFRRAVENCSFDRTGRGSPAAVR